MTIYKIDDIGGCTELKITLEDSYYTLEQEWTKTKLWSAKVWAYKGSAEYEDWLRLNERPGGAIQYSEPHEKRKSTGTRDAGEAITWAHERLRARHTRKRLEGSAKGRTAAPVAGVVLPISEIPELLVKLNLLDEVTPRQKRKILLACEAMIEAVGGERDAERLKKRDVAVFYAKRSGCKPNGAKLSEEELRQLGVEEAGMFLGKRKRKPVKVSTAHNNLCDFRAALTHLLGEEDAHGRPFLTKNVLLGYDLGHGPGTMTVANHERRAYYIMKYADAATKLWNERRRNRQKHCAGPTAGRQVVQVPLGVVRYGYAMSWYRGWRFNQIQNLNMEDLLITEAAIHAAICKCRETLGQARAQPEWASIWAEYGAVFLAMEFAQKPGFDRVCPDGAITASERDRCLELRRAQGLPEKGSLFRYIHRDGVMKEHHMYEILHLAEKLAWEECTADGYDPMIVFNPNARIMHDSRTDVSNRWAEMGWENSKNAAWLASWSTNIRMGNAGDTVYKQLNPHLVLALANGLKLSEALELSGVADKAKARANMVVPF